MPLNKVKPGSNMYQFLNDYPHKRANKGYTINFVKGRCEFGCSYCYYQNNPRYKSKIGKLRFDEKELKTNLGSGNYIFVGSSCDMWANSVPRNWINKVLEYCNKFNNKYLFQTKNPERFHEFLDNFPDNIILGTTIETNWHNDLSKAPHTDERASWMIGLEKVTMVSIEPIVMPFDVEVVVDWIKMIRPEFVSIGVDSKGHNLPEPSLDKIQLLITELRKFTKVIIKNNLKRLENDILPNKSD